MCPWWENSQLNPGQSSLVACINETKGGKPTHEVTNAILHFILLPFNTWKDTETFHQQICPPPSRGWIHFCVTSDSCSLIRSGRMDAPWLYKIEFQLRVTLHCAFSDTSTDIFKSRVVWNAALGLRRDSQGCQWARWQQLLRVGSNLVLVWYTIYSVVTVFFGRRVVISNLESCLEDNLTL